MSEQRQSPDGISGTTINGMNQHTVTASKKSSSKDVEHLIELPHDVSYTVPFSHRFHASYSHPLLRHWQSSAASFTAEDLMYPIFITDDDDAIQPIHSLPQQSRYGVNRIHELLDPLYHEYGLKSVLLFGVLSSDSKKSEDAYMAVSSQNPVARVIPRLKERYPNLVIAVDICLCAYTTHGHCGILQKHQETGEYECIDNDASIKRIAEMSCNLAVAGAHIVAPSDMMDGRSGAIKLGLKHMKLDARVSLMTYSAKFASCLYGPFRDAASSGAKFGDRQTYQLPVTSESLATRAILRDVEEGADFLIVKPSIWYLDIVKQAADICKVPLAIYHVSGEYAMLWHAAAAGAFDLKTAVYEHMNSARRAGAKLLITYYTPMLLKWIKEDMQDKLHHMKAQ